MEALQGLVHALAGPHGAAVAVADEHSVWHVSSHALLLGTVSGLSLPIAAGLGVVLSPVNDAVCAGMMAFGAGALLFAVTVELYGHSMAEVHAGRMQTSEVLVTIISALPGAIIYLYANRMLEQSVSHALPVRAVVDESEVECSGSECWEPSADLKMVGSVSESSPLVDTPPLGPRRSYSSVSAPTLERGALGTAAAFRRSSSVSGGFYKPLLKQMSLRNPTTHRKASLVPQMTSPLIGSGLSAFTAVTEDEVAEAGQKAKALGFALFLGLLLDGVPEGILMGFLAAERHLSPVLVISLFVANFPEAFSSSTLFVKGDYPTSVIMSMWAGLCLLVGSLAGLSCFILLSLNPGFPHTEDLSMGVLYLIAHIEGLTGGAMLACISSVMLPESFERSDKDGSLLASSGFLCTAGFLASVFLKVTLG